MSEIEFEALKLDLKSRARLAHVLLQSLDSLSEKENKRLWAEEAMRRDAEIEAGTAKEIPGDEAFRDVVARLQGEKLSQYIE